MLLVSAARSRSRNFPVLDSHNLAVCSFKPHVPDTIWLFLCYHVAHMHYYLFSVKFDPLQTVMKFLPLKLKVLSLFHFLHISIKYKSELSGFCCFFPILFFWNDSAQWAWFLTCKSHSEVFQILVSFIPVRSLKLSNQDHD